MAVAFQIPGNPRKQVPMQVGVTVAQKFNVHFFGAKRMGHRLIDKGHLLQKKPLRFRGQVKQFRHMLFAQKQRITAKVLVIAQHDIPCAQLFDKIRVLPLLDQRNAVTNQAHSRLTFFPATGFGRSGRIRPWRPAPPLPRL